MPIVTVELWEGKPAEQKNQIIKDITATFLKLGISPEHIHVILKENPKRNWAIGGKLCSEM
jgi:4-oxalocrotonate tautomerase family enzyme